MTPSLTVIVPHYNRPELVGRALASIQRQTVQPAEVLLVDDHSTKENRAALEKFASAANQANRSFQQRCLLAKRSGFRLVLSRRYKRPGSLAVICSSDFIARLHPAALHL